MPEGENIENNGKRGIENEKKEEKDITTCQLHTQHYLVIRQQRSFLINNIASSMR
jgi:hypothetical protein